MSATIWVDTDKERTIELGGTIQLYQVFQEMHLVCNGEFDNYPELFGVPSQTEDTDDAESDWLVAVRIQAALFLQEYRKRLTDHTVWVLEQLIKGGE